MSKYLSNLRFWCPDCALWLAQRHYPSWNPPFVCFLCTGGFTNHHPWEPGSRRVCRERGASFSFPHRATWNVVKCVTASRKCNFLGAGSSQERPRHWEVGAQQPLCLPHHHSPSFISWVELLQPGLSDSSFFRAGSCAWLQLSPGTRNCSNAKI